MDLVDKISCNIVDVTWTELIVAIAFVVISFILRKVITRGVMHLINKSGDQNAQLRISVLESIFKPFSYMIVIFGIYIAHLILPLSLTWTKAIENLLKISSTIIFFVSVYNILVPVFSYLQSSPQRKPLRQEFYYFFFRLSRILIIILGLMTALEMWGVNVFAFVAGLGFVAAAIAFAAQDMLKNIFASLSLLIEETFHQGEVIRTKDLEGTVEHIGFRKTTIRQANKSLVSVPNSSLTDSPIINLSRMNMRQILFPIDLDYKTTVDQIRQMIDQLRIFIHSNSDLEVNPKKATVNVCVESITPKAIRISCECYTKTNNYLEFCKIREVLMLKVIEIVASVGARFSSDNYTVVFDQKIEKTIDNLGVVK